MRIASYNVENLFRRPVALQQETWAQGRPVLEAFGELQLLLEQPVYSGADAQRILQLLGDLGLLKSDESKWAFLRRTRGQLLRRHQDGTIEVTAAGRGSWIGWLELKRKAVNAAATRNTGRVVADMAADVLAVIEAEDPRAAALQRGRAAARFSPRRSAVRVSPRDADRRQRRPRHRRRAAHARRVRNRPPP